MRVLVIGQGLNDVRFKAIVDATSADMARRELIECMGMCADTILQFMEELKEIGFIVHGDNGVYDDIVSIPINFNADELF